MAHIHTRPGQHDLTVSAFIVREGIEAPRLLLHRHKSLPLVLQPGGHVELDEDPWTALVREIGEETGYASGQLLVLQPPSRLWAASSGPAEQHPQPVSVRTHDFDPDGLHKHTDLAFAFVTGADPVDRPAPGESASLFWATRAEVDTLADLPDNVRAIAGFVLDVAVATWDRVEASSNG